MKKLEGFTLIEIVVTVIIIGIIMAFSIPNFVKSVEKGRARRARVNLMAIHAAATIYKGNAQTFLPTDQNDLSQINNALNLNLIDDSFNYKYTYDAMDAFSVIATRSTGDYTYEITDAPISSSNPSCSSGSGTCPI